jgi:hypothetical protein
MKVQLRVQLGAIEPASWIHKTLCLSANQSIYRLQCNQFYRLERRI